MSDDDFDDEDDLDEDLDDDLDLDDDADDDTDDADAVDGAADHVEGAADGDAEPAEELTPQVTDRTVGEGADDEDDEVVDLDEELHPDDVEEALDVVLRERTAAASLEDEVDDEPDERASNRIRPRRAGEFLCQSCFLVLPRSQLADEQAMLCTDCA